MKIGNKMKGLLDRAGFVDIVEISYDWPYNGRKLKYIGKLTIGSLSSYTMGFLTRNLGWKRSEVDVLCAMAGGQLRNGNFGTNSAVQLYFRV
jgi:hypothetical protein